MAQQRSYQSAGSEHERPSHTESDSGQGAKVHPYDMGMPIYSIGFSKKPFLSQDGTENVLLGVGSSLPERNQV